MEKENHRTRVYDDLWFMMVTWLRRDFWKQRFFQWGKLRRHDSKRDLSVVACNMTQMLHVWNIYLHLSHVWGESRYIFHTWWASGWWYFFRVPASKNSQAELESQRQGLCRRRLQPKTEAAAAAKIGLEHSEYHGNRYIPKYWKYYLDLSWKYFLGILV